MSIADLTRDNALDNKFNTALNEIFADVHDDTLDVKELISKLTPFKDTDLRVDADTLRAATLRSTTSVASSATNLYAAFPSEVEEPHYDTDVLIVGSGPIGAVFAQRIVAAGKKVLMIDMGGQASRRIGDHRKNDAVTQRDLSLFTNVIKGELQPLSVPTTTVDANIEPSSWQPEPSQMGYLQNGQNPNQSPFDNLSAAAATRVVGGMGIHWTCCTPRQHVQLERSTLFTEKEWECLYNTAEKLFRTKGDAFDDSIRQQLVKHTLQKAFPGRGLLSMPLACERSKTNKDFVEWSCSATILGPLSEAGQSNHLFEMKPNTQCIQLCRENGTGKVVAALVKNILTGEITLIRAKKFVICAGAVLTPGLLFSSQFTTQELPALGHYMTEQIMSFCQVVLERSLVDSVPSDPYKLGWDEKVKDHKKQHPNDPLPFPFNDPDPQCYFRLTDEYPWHTQIHRDAFGYGEVPPTIDQRVVVDLRWFTFAEVVKSNRIEYSPLKEMDDGWLRPEVTDGFGMPQPTFRFTPSDTDAKRSHRMITDMVQVARTLGGFLPGAEPRILVPGSALHICGTHRAGESKVDSVVNRFGKVWGHENVILGGCGVIPTQNACNPTLTAACFALAAAVMVVRDLNKYEDWIKDLCQRE